MAKTEQRQAIHRYANEMGGVITKSMSPKHLSNQSRIGLIKEAVQSTANGQPKRIHIVFRTRVDIITEQDLSKRAKLSKKKLNKFARDIAKRMNDCRTIVELEKSPDTQIPLFQQSIDSIEGHVEKRKISAFEEFIASNPDFSHLDKPRTEN